VELNASKKFLQADVSPKVGIEIELIRVKGVLYTYPVNHFKSGFWACVQDLLSEALFPEGSVTKCRGMG
jgi:hypothetical protein